MRPGLYLSILAIILGVMGFLGPVPGTFAVRPESVRRTPPVEARCLRLSYQPASAGQRMPQHIRLGLEPAREFDRPWARGYRARGWPSYGGYIYAAWRAAAMDSIDIMWHHSPLMRIPLPPASPTVDTLVGRGGEWNHMTFYSAVLGDRAFAVRATEMDCPDPMPGYPL